MRRLAAVLLLCAPLCAGAADLANGARLFGTRCASCHSVGPSARAGFGPQLNGIHGRRAGSTPDFRYSPAMQQSGIVWNDKSLAAFLDAPDEVVPGTGNGRALCGGRFDSGPDARSEPAGDTWIGAGLVQPIGIAFIGPNDAFILEKASGQVKRAINGVLQPAPVLDLAVNSASERGLLSIALHPNFPAVPFRLHPLDRKLDRRRHVGDERGAAAGQPRRPLHLERQHADAGPELRDPAPARPADRQSSRARP
jgi:cytochrome c